MISFDANVFRIFMMIYDYRCDLQFALFTFKTEVTCALRGVNLDVY